MWPRAAGGAPPQRDDIVDWRHKGAPFVAAPPTADAADLRGWDVDDLPTPLVLLKDAALESNLQVMADWCRHHGVELAPHGKTTMSPELIQRQLAHGAWAITAATPAQVRTLRAFGVDRILLANQLVDRRAIAWVAAERRRDPGFAFLCYVDSVAGVRLLDEALGATRGAPLDVLLEIGVAGERTGCRSVEEAGRVARAVGAAQHLRLAGVAGFEGVIGGASRSERIRRVDGFLRLVRTVTSDLTAAGALSRAAEIIVSAGGSAFPDRVVDALTGDWPATAEVTTVLRSGCYVTHDSGVYDQVSPFGSRHGGRVRLEPALEVWGRVLSTPEHGLAVADFGKRDVSHDSGLPRPLARRRGVEHVPVAPTLAVTRLNDQHAFLEDPTGTDLRVGDVVVCGVSHPCTTFDKWRAIPVVNARYQVTGVVHTYF